MDEMPPRFEEPLCAQGLDYLFYEPDEDEELADDDRLSIAEREALARQVCGNCRHVVECALHGLKHERYGVWGGLSMADRKALGGKSAGGGRRADYAIKRMLQSLHPAAVKAILVLWRAHQKSEMANEEEAA